MTSNDNVTCWKTLESTRYCFQMLADVEFTPLAELAAIAPVEEATSAVDERSLLKRGTTCSGRRSINLGQLDEANRQLAKNANAQGWYNKGANCWVSHASLSCFVRAFCVSGR